MTHLFCIKDQKPWRDPVTKTVLPGPEWGDDCTVLETIRANGKCYHILAGWPNDLAYDYTQFIPLSDVPDADEINEAENEEIVPNPNGQVASAFQDILNSVL